MSKRRTVAVVGCLLLTLTTSARAGAAGAASVTPTGPITVSAASSLTDVLPVIAASFAKRFPGVTVRFNFGGSSALVEQIKMGAPVDVLATASVPTMWSAVSAGQVANPVTFASNSMAIVTPGGNPAGITSIWDLSRPGVLVAACAIAVPCGSAARDLFAKNKVSVKPATLELDVRSVLGKVVSGEVDAGIVYVTDARSVGTKVSSIQIVPAANVTTVYPMAVVIGTSNPVTAKAFVDYVRDSLAAQGILRAYGFAKPW